LARVEALARRRYAKRSPKLVEADLKLNTTAKTVWRGSLDQNLPPILTAMLEYQILHTEQAVSHSRGKVDVTDAYASPASNDLDTTPRPVRGRRSGG
jgi:DNA-binding response OmpR family regulator